MFGCVVLLHVCGGLRGGGAASPRYIVFTLTFDSSPIKGEGIQLVGVVLLLSPFTSELGSESVMMSPGGCVMLVFEIQDYDAE